MNATAPLEPMMTPKEVAAFLRISESQVYVLAKKRTLAGIRVGVQWRFSPAAVRAFAEGGPPAGPAPVTPIAAGRRRRV